MDAIKTYGFSTAPFLADGGITFGKSESGFDTLSARYYGRTTGPSAYIEANWPTGISFSGYPNMHVANVDVNQESVDVWAFTVHCKGLLGIQNVKRTMNTKTQSYTTGPVTIPGGGAVSQAQGIYVNLSCEFHYVSFFLPLLNVEPQDAIPPAGASLPSPPSNPFASPEPTTKIYQYPYGWIRSGLDVDTVNGAEVYMIREEWEYKYEFLPG